MENFIKQMKRESIPRKTVESTWEENGMEFTIGELKVPTFYFLDEKKFWHQLNKVLKLTIGSKLLFNKHFYMTGVWNHLPRGVSRNFVNP